MDKQKNIVKAQFKGKIIINADDYGYDEAHTLGVIKAFEEGLISNTTIMVNMPFFAEACSLAEKHGIKDKIGLHLNLVEGVPLTDGIRNCATFCNEDGIMHGLWRQSVSKTSFLNNNEKSLLKQEILAQFLLFEQSGFSLKHFDTHGHAHTYFSVCKLLKNMLKEKGYHYNIRIAKNLSDTKSNSLKSLYKKAINKYIPRKVRCSNYFTDIKGYLKNPSLSEESITEIMCHPCWIDGAIFNPDDFQLTELKDRLPHWDIDHF